MKSLANARFPAVICFLLIISISLLSLSSFAQSPNDKHLDIAISHCKTIEYEIDSTDHRDCVREQLRVLTNSDTVTTEVDGDTKKVAEAVTASADARCVPDWFRLYGGSINSSSLCSRPIRPLRKCPPNDFLEWTNCEGTYVFVKNSDHSSIRNSKYDNYLSYSINAPKLGTYTGDWKWNTPHGTGALTGDNGEKYVGEFFQGFFQGNGTYIYADGSVYTGTFERNLRSGRGKYLYADGRLYEGDFKQNTLSGTGTLTFPNGERYVGEFRDNKASGFGTFFFKDGRRYEGQWKNDSWNGTGTLFNSDNSILLKGIWKDGKLKTKQQ